MLRYCKVGSITQTPLNSPHPESSHRMPASYLMAFLFSALIQHPLHVGIIDV